MLKHWKIDKPSGFLFIVHFDSILKVLCAMDFPQKFNLTHYINNPTYITKNFVVISKKNICVSAFKNSIIYSNNLLLKFAFIVYW